MRLTPGQRLTTPDNDAFATHVTLSTPETYASINASAGKVWRISPKLLGLTIRTRNDGRPGRVSVQFQAWPPGGQAALPCEF